MFFVSRVLTWNRGWCRIGLANGVATVGTANSGDTNPRCFWWACVVLEWVNVPTGSRTDSKIAQRQGSSPPKPLGVFLLCHAVAVLFAVAMRLTRRLTRKGYRMVGMAFPTRCKSVKPAAGVNLQAGGKWYPIHSMRRSEFFRVKPSLLSYPLGVGGRLGEIIEYLYIRQSMCSKNEKKYT